MALALGRTVEELNATMSPSEYQEWLVYHELEPWGSPADDFRMRNLLDLTFHLNAQPGSQSPDWLDHDPEYTAMLRSRIAPDLDDKLEAHFDALMARQGPTSEEDPGP